MSSSLRWCRGVVVALAAGACWGAPAVAGAQAEFLFSIGGAGRFDGASGVATDCCGERIYVSDRNLHRIQVFDRGGAPLLQWGTLGSGAGQFDDPDGLAMDCLDNLYVADEDNNRVQRFAPDGSHELTITGGPISGAPPLLEPRGVAVSRDGENVWVADRMGSAVLRFDSEGNYLFSIGGLHEPFDLNAACDGVVVVADTFDNRVRVFTDDGAPFADWFVDLPVALTADCACNVFVATRNTVRQFDIRGGLVAAWGSPGGGPGEFAGLAGMATDGLGRLYTAETVNQRVQVFDVSATTTPGVSRMELPDDLEVECPAPSSGPGSESEWLASARVTGDGCGAAELRHALVNERFGCGATFTRVHEFWVADECGEGPRERREYAVVDTTPPELSAGAAVFEVALWPPNHARRLFFVDDLVTARDACGDAEIVASGCASSQPEDVHGGPGDDGSNGDGHTREDCVVSSDGHAFALRAERLGACGPGSVRLYAVALRATDACGNVATGTGFGRVEHDRRGRGDGAGLEWPVHAPLPFDAVHATTYGAGCP